MKKGLFCVYTLLLLMMAVGMSFTVVSCSSDDDGEMINGDIIEAGDDIHFSFYLMDENKKVKNKFKKGENFYFNLIITNNSNSTLYGYPNHEQGDIILPPDLFCVYSEDGEKIDIPYTGMFCEFRGMWCVIHPHDEINLYCPWGDSKTNDFAGPFCGLKHLSSLSPGKYYVHFTILHKNYPDKNNYLLTKQEFKLNFEIQ